MSAATASPSSSSERAHRQHRRRAAEVLLHGVGGGRREVVTEVQPGRQRPPVPVPGAGGGDVFKNR